MVYVHESFLKVNVIDSQHYKQCEYIKIRCSFFFVSDLNLQYFSVLNGLLKLSSYFNLLLFNRDGLLNYLAIFINLIA